MIRNSHLLGRDLHVSVLALCVSDVSAQVVMPGLRRRRPESERQGRI